jgi:hypothetical protein
MNDFDRISGIQKAHSDEQLDIAMTGYAQQAATLHPALQLNQAFNNALEAGQFMRALEIIRQARRVDGEEYFGVIRVLEFAAERRIAIMMKGVAKAKSV